LHSTWLHGALPSSRTWSEARTMSAPSCTAGPRWPRTCNMSYLDLDIQAAADSRIRRRIFVRRKSAEKNTDIRILKWNQYSNKWLSCYLKWNILVISKLLVITDGRRFCNIKETDNNKYITDVDSHFSSIAQPKLFIINRISADFFCAIIRLIRISAEFFPAIRIFSDYRLRVYLDPVESNLWKSQFTSGSWDIVSTYRTFPGCGPRLLWSDRVRQQFVHAARWRTACRARGQATLSKSDQDRRWLDVDEPRARLDGLVHATYGPCRAVIN